MAIVSKPDGQNVTLYNIPDDELAKYAMSAEDAGKMFPKKEGRTRDDAAAVAKSRFGGRRRAGLQQPGYLLCLGMRWLRKLRVRLVVLLVTQGH